MMGGEHPTIVPCIKFADSGAEISRKLDAAWHTSLAWWRDLNRYHWFVLIVAALSWLLDCLDQQLFNIARVPAMRQLLNTSDIGIVTEYGGYATFIFLAGWATGGEMD